MSIDINDTAEEIKRDAEATLKDAITEHMDSAIYDVECSECGNSVDWEAKVDGDYQLTVQVTPCPCGGKDETTN